MESANGADTGETAGFANPPALRTAPFAKGGVWVLPFVKGELEGIYLSTNDLGKLYLVSLSQISVFVYCFSAIALQILAGDIGRVSIRTPTAWWIALAIAAGGGTIGTSPTPRIPIG